MTQPLHHGALQEDLAAYALGELAPAAAAELRAHVATCAECPSLLADLYAGLAVLALTASGPAPPARSRERLLSAAHATAARNHSLAPAPLPGPPPAAPNRNRWFWLPTGAAVLLAALALFLGSSNRTLRRELDLARADQQSTLSQTIGARILLEGLTSAQAKRVTLTSAMQRPQPSAQAMYMPHHRAFALIAENLAPVPPGKAYQLWMLPANGGAPIPSATFRPNAAGAALMTLAGMHNTPEVKGFALTVEPEAGSAAPTSPIVLSGSGN